MPLNTITDLQNAVISWSNASLSTTQATDMITIAENRIYREMRVRQLESQTTISISNDVASVPADYLEIKNVRLSTNPTKPLERTSAEIIYKKFPYRSPDGQPSFIAREGSNFIFGPTPGSGYSIVLNYYAKPSTIVGSTLSGLSAAHPELFLYAAMADATPYIGQDQRVIWEQKYQMLKNIIETKDQDEYFSGSPVAVTTG